MCTIRHAQCVSHVRLTASYMFMLSTFVLYELHANYLLYMNVLVDVYLCLDVYSFQI